MHGLLRKQDPFVFVNSMKTHLFSKIGFHMGKYILSELKASKKSFNTRKNMAVCWRDSFYQATSIQGAQILQFSADCGCKKLKMLFQPFVQLSWDAGNTFWSYYFSYHFWFFVQFRLGTFLDALASLDFKLSAAERFNFVLDFQIINDNQWKSITINDNQR